jgi:chromosome segregation ATPase
VLYLAEIQKKSGIMGSRAELKLLACQRSEQMWNAVSGDELVPLSAEQANNYNAGSLVLVDLTQNKQIQRFQEAGRQLVTILQNFSKLQERVRVQEEEIEQWRASLTFQSQELQRREIEIEARQDLISNMDTELAQFEQQRDDLDRTRAEIQQLQSDVESNRQNLDGAWAHLKGEQERLEELQSQLRSHSTGFSPEQAHSLQQWLDQLGAMTDSIDTLPERLQHLTQAIAAQQEILQHYQNQLNEAVQAAGHTQQHVVTQTQDVANRKAELANLQRSLDDKTTELAEQQQRYQVTQALHDQLSHELQTQDDLRQKICQASGLSDSAQADVKVDLPALENLSLEDLQTVVANLQRDLVKVSNFVNDQEEELRYQQQAIDELQAKINQASEYDRWRLETELADEKDRYRLLDETLIGQRRSLREREAVLNAHLSVLQRRQGQQSSSDGLQVLLNQWCEHRQQQVHQLQNLADQLQQLTPGIEQLQSSISEQTLTQVSLQQDLVDLEQALQARQAEALAHDKHVHDMTELLQKLQAQLDQMQAGIAQLHQSVGETQTSREHHQSLLGSIRQNLNGAMN